MVSSQRFRFASRRLLVQSDFRSVTNETQGNAGFHYIEQPVRSEWGLGRGA